MSKTEANPDKEKQKEVQNFFKEIETLSSKNRRDRLMTVENQLDRLTNEKFQNPYDVLLLTAEANDEEIRRAYRNISVLVHPDKCKDSRAYDAFHVVEQAYKTLHDPEKRKVYQIIMREAREKTEFERNRENKRRQKMGLPNLPEDTFEGQYREICKQLFDEIEERKNHFIKMEEASRIRRRELLQERKIKEKIRELSEEEWEKTRDERVKNWRNFSQKKSLVGTKKSTNEIRAPAVKMEERPASAPKLEQTNKPMGINEDYKKLWK